MKKTEKDYLDGLYAAALICMDIAKQRNSVYANAIMRYRMIEALKLEVRCKMAKGKADISTEQPAMRVLSEGRQDNASQCSRSHNTA